MSPVLATAAIEVEALRLLNQISADLGQEVSVKREADGALHVEAIVESEKRKSEIVSALAPVAHERAVRILIETTAEAQVRIKREQRRSAGQSGSQDVSTEGITAANAIPVDADLRRYLQSKDLSEQQMEEEISRLSNRVLNRSHRAMLHAFALKNLVQRFSPEDLRSLDPAARGKLRAMISTHAQAFQREMTAIRQELAPIFGPASSAGSAEEEIDVTEAGLFRAASRLAELAAATNESIQSDFAISSGNRSAVARTPAFWRSLKSAERLAARIANGQ